MSGLDLVGAIRRLAPVLPVLLVTAFPDVRQAVDAIKDGAVDYLSKPVDLDELRDLIVAALGTPAAAAAALPPLPKGVVLRSPQMQGVLRDAHLVAASDVTVLITGESGTGKEIIADIIHAWSPRAQRSLIKLNCAAMPETMVESELFGHAKGAFTGAVTAREGRWRAAAGGTLMLDEIGELPVRLQAKLLRSLQDGSYSPLGSDATLTADVRVIAATNRDLEAEVAAGSFREDLYYRLNVVELHLPPLRERPDDIEPLAHVFANAFVGESVRISPGALAVLTAYSWPGNVRELRNVLERACLMARGGVLLPEHLSPKIVRESAGKEVCRPAAADGSEPRTLAELEREKILATLAECHGNRTRAAERLGIGRRTLIYKLKSYGAAEDDSGSV